MRDCYKKFWKTVLAEKMQASLPQFALKEGPARKAADEAKPSSKPIKFVWNPADKLVFTVEFSAFGKQDYFDAWCFWSEKGKTGPNGSAMLDFPFPEDVYGLMNAATHVQVLSAAANDRATVLYWYFWKPKTSQFDDEKAWYAEFMAEEMRVVPDAEARPRVEVAVDRAISDVKRLALPWFEKKLDWYQKNRK